MLKPLQISLKILTIWCSNNRLVPLKQYNKWMFELIFFFFDGDTSICKVYLINFSNIPNIAKVN